MRIPGDAQRAGSEILCRSSRPCFCPQVSHGSQQPRLVLQPLAAPVLPLHSALQPWVLANLLSHFDWTWVGLTGSDNRSFEWLEQQVQTEAL